MKKKWEERYFVTAVVSVPIYKGFSKTEAYRQAAKDGWGTVYRDENGDLVCDEDCCADLYMKNGGYFGIRPYEEINTKEMPKQAECAAIITGDSCGLSFWAEDFSKIHIFVTYDENGLIDTYRVEYGDTPVYDGEVEISFDDLYQQAEGDWKQVYRAELPGTVEYQFKREAETLAQEAGETWMNAEEREQFRQVCGKIDRIKSAWGFRCEMGLIYHDYSRKIINAARKFKKCHNAAQYEPKQAAPEAEAGEAEPHADEEGGETVARKYRYIDFEDRKRIARLWSIGTPAQAIAEEIGTDPATISRELRRGYPGKDGRNKRPAYNPVIAQKAVDAGIARRGRKRGTGPGVAV